MTPCFAAEAETAKIGFTDEEKTYISSPEPITVGVFYSEFNMSNDRLEPTELLFCSSYIVIGRKGEQFDKDAAIKAAIPIGLLSTLNEAIQGKDKYND